MPTPLPLAYEQFYHIYNRGNGGENIFREAHNYNYFLALYAKYIEPIAETYAYCLLRNHFHLLARIRDRETCQVSKDLTGLEFHNPSKTFSNFFNAYTKAINQTYGRTGSLFQRPFGRIAVTNAKYFVHLIHYIHFNPQKHGFVSDYREYPYSSYSSLCSDKATRLRREQVLEWFGSRAQFAALHQQRVDERVIAELIGEDLD